MLGVKWLHSGFTFQWPRMRVVQTLALHSVCFQAEVVKLHSQRDGHLRSEYYI